MKTIRILTATVGGYILASLFNVALTFILPFSNKAESVLLSVMLSFLAWLFIVLYAFSSIELKKLCIQFAIASIALLAIIGLYTMA